MNCQEFERLWNETLDRSQSSRAEQNDAIARHEASCPSCRLIGAGYRAIQLLLTEPAPMVEVPQGFAARVLAADAAQRAWSSRRHALRWLAPLATAALVVVAISPGLLDPRTPPRLSTINRPLAKAVDPGELTAALTDVGVASLSLAREASAPAARVGGEVIGVAGFSEGVSTIGVPVPAPGGTGTGASLWEGVGERVNAGVRPLTGTARSAFGFLVGVAPRG